MVCDLEGVAVAYF